MKPWTNDLPAVIAARTSLLERVACVGLWLVYALALMWLLCLTGCVSDPDDRRFFYDSWRIRNTDQTASDFSR